MVSVQRSMRWGIYFILGYISGPVGIFKEDHGNHRLPRNRAKLPKSLKVAERSCFKLGTEILQFFSALDTYTHT